MKWTDRKNKGQSLVEFTLVAPLLLLLLVGIAEFSRAWMTQSILTGAAREAVRIYAVDPAFGGGSGPAILRAADILASANIIGAPPVELVDNGLGTVTATQRYTFPLAVAGFVPGLDADIPLFSSTSMHKEY